MILIKVSGKVLMSSRLTRGGRKDNGPAFSASQWPSLAYRAEKKCALLLTAVVAVSFVISSPSSTFTCAIVCLKFFFSLKNCKFFFYFFIITIIIICQIKWEFVKNKFESTQKVN